MNNGLILSVLISVFFLQNTCAQSDCYSFIDKLERGDTVKISICFSINKGERKEDVLICKNETGSVCALLTTDTLHNSLLIMTPSKVDVIKSFELNLRKQNVISNIPAYIHSAAKYSIQFKQSVVLFSSKNEFFSLITELNK